MFQKSDAKIQITITMAYLIRIKYPLSGFNYHFSDVNVPFLKQLLLRNCAVDFVEICNVYVGKMIIKAAKRILNSDQICCSYSNLNFGVTFFGTQCILVLLLH